MITFRIVDTSEVGRAYAWHADFAAANDAIFPRTERAFGEMALDRLVWCAITDTDHIVGMSYANVKDDLSEVEIGGLMVDATMRGKGLGDVLMRLPLAHLLVNEQPLAWSPAPTILTHALKDNHLPRGIIGRVGFRFATDVTIPGAMLPGLRTESDGNVHGTEFHLAIPDGLHSVADWLGAWTGKLNDGSDCQIDMREGERLSDWADAIRGMAAPPNRTE